MKELVVYTKDRCFYCDALKFNFSRWKVDYTEKNLKEGTEEYAEFKESHSTFPKVAVRDNETLTFFGPEIQTFDITEDMVKDALSV